MKKRRNTLIIIELILFVLSSILMYRLQSHLFYKNADREIDLTFEDTDRIVTQAEEDSDDFYNSFELIQKAKAQMAKFYIRNDEDTVYSVTSMKKLKSLLDVCNVYLADKYGRIAFYAEPAPIRDFFNDLSFFTEMEKIAGTNKASEVYYDYLEDPPRMNQMNLNRFIPSVPQLLITDIMWL